LTRGAQSGLIDLRRVAVLRTASDFDRPYPRQGVLESLQAQRALAGALRISTDNLVRAGMPLVEAIVQHWDLWQDGVPGTVQPGAVQPGAVQPGAVQPRAVQPGAP
jgi:purine nucleoside permease